MPAGSFNATLTTTPPLSINQFPMDGAATPGNVGICLSGGGSRAMMAGMGQLRALANLMANGQNMLSQAKALSTVSGGSWIGVPFNYLPATGPSDSVYLGPFVQDQGTLTPANLGVVPAGNAGTPVASSSFSVQMLALEAALISLTFKTPANMLWQTLIALHILKPLGLYSPSLNLTPKDLFSYNAATLRNDVIFPNLRLALSKAQLFADQTSGSRMHRPFLVCNMAMFLKEQGTAFQLLGPVQGTPFITGILATPTGKDANGLDVGGGGVTSFAFNSALGTARGSNVTVAQSRQWALTDIVGTSSAAFAEAIQNLLAGWAANPQQFAQAVAEGHDQLMEWTRTNLAEEMSSVERESVSMLSGVDVLVEAEAAQLGDIKDLIPQYGYWPVRNPQATPNAKPTRFADGGSLENAGVASLLAYSDIDSLISFINTATPLAPSAFGVLDPSGKYYPNSNYMVASTIPPLFGYQPYDTKKGYVLYSVGPVSQANSIFANNKVFAPEQFPLLLEGLAAAAGNGLDTNAVVFSQKLQVLANPWFGVAGGKTVTVVWNYLNYATAWNALLQPSVQSLVAAERTTNNFPNYSTLSTHLTATQLNLLANFTSWAVASAEQNSGVFSKLFAAGQAAVA
jgi:hypothetical protein